MKKTVLIIDDEAPIRQSFMDLFEDLQWHPLVAESGERALEILDKESADCAIVDIRMGGMTGDEFIRKACRKKPDMAFVICTASPGYQIPTDLLALPKVSRKVFKKPVKNFEELKEALLQLMTKTGNKQI